MRPYFYKKQIKSYITMFMSIFSGLQVKTGKRDGGTEFMMDVPIIYGSRDRVSAAVLNENTQTKLLRLPIMSAYMNSFNIAPMRMKGSGNIRSSTYVPVGGLLPDDVVSLKQRMPVPYDVTLELSIFASNQDQLLQLLEQITMVFDPSIQIERSDAPFDWAKVTIVELTDIQFEENYPAASDRRKNIVTLSFKMPIWIEVPATFKNDVVKSIKLRIDAATDTFEWLEEIPGAPDTEYTEIHNAEVVREGDC